MKAIRGTHRWTVEEYHRMAEVGLLSERDRVELLDGEVVDVNAIGSLHAAIVTAIVDLLYGAVGGKVTIRVQQPIRLDDHSEPEPDIALALRRDYRHAHPTPSDVLLVIEVADSSAGSDRGRKLPAYARSRIREVWLVDLVASQVEVHREPVADRFTKVSPHRAGDTIEPEALPGVRLAVADMLP